jgi:hypothetical protein
MISILPPEIHRMAVRNPGNFIAAKALGLMT